jgi:hypothetical protein
MMNRSAKKSSLLNEPSRKSSPLELQGPCVILNPDNVFDYLSVDEQQRIVLGESFIRFTQDGLSFTAKRA